jgi:hypothetical protein
MKIRLLLALGTAVIGAGVFAPTAAADRPLSFTEDVTGGQIACGDTVVTATTGTGYNRVHVKQLPSGLYHEIFRETFKGIRLTDGQTTYHAAGSIGGNFVTSNPDSDAGIVRGFFHTKINIVGPNGLLGSVAFNERLGANGSFTETDRGTCEFIGGE